MYLRPSVRCALIFRRFHVSSIKETTQKSPPTCPAQPRSSVNTNVPGLSSKIVKEKCEPLGPGASKSGEYKVPEYYSYDRFSFHEAEVEMAQFRCPQPSPFKK